MTAPSNVAAGSSPQPRNSEAQNGNGRTEGNRSQPATNLGTQIRGSRASGAQIRPGQTLAGRYTLLSRIATGGMGEVWRARDAMTGMLVAAKVLRPELTGEEISLSRLRLEAQNAMRARHPNIAAVLDSGEDGGRGWIVMELVSGRPLVDYVGEGRKLSAPQLIPVLIQAGYALDGSAQRGIVHRDIKPANIMVRDDGLVKLTDFGISYAQGQATLTAVGMVMGTAQYLSPEQAMGSEATPLGDLYSLGIIAYEALAGTRPFTGKTIVDIAMAHVHQPVPDLPEDVPTELANVVYSLLAKDPQERPESGIALVRQLTAAADAIGVSTAPTPLGEPPKDAGSQPIVASTVPAKHSVDGAKGSDSAKPAKGLDPSRSAKISAARRAASEGTSKPATHAQTQLPTAPPRPAGRPGSMWTPLADSSPFHVPAPGGAAGTAHRALGGSSGAYDDRTRAIPARAPSQKTVRQPSRTAQQGESPLWKKPGFWVLVAVGILLLVFVVASYFGAKSSVSAYHQDCLAPQCGDAFKCYSQEVVSWLTPVLTF